MEQTGNLQVAYCRICGKSLTPEEQRPALGTIYCADHVPAPTVPPPVSPSTGSAVLAFILGLIPGVGAMYNTQYAKGLIHFLVFGLLISMANSDSVGDMQILFGMMVPAWVIYMAFEAYHTARRREDGLPVDEYSSVLPIGGTAAGFPAGPLVLIGLGVIFLLNNLGVLRFSVIFKFWPIALIAFGVYLLYQRTQERGAASNTSTGVPGEVGHE
ncbi:MAG: hypothetical protein FJW38_01855 [Acidobacteria bacterium]|nr:hypothetical protein [Acidobacteriota bacterium]